MVIINAIAALLIVAGVLFFIAGTVGILRFPDTFTRLHALTKADNVGLGLIIVGLALQAGSLVEAARLLFIWLLVLPASSASCHLIARATWREGVQPWRSK